MGNPVASHIAFRGKPQHTKLLQPQLWPRLQVHVWQPEQQCSCFCANIRYHHTPVLGTNLLMMLSRPSPFLYTPTSPVVVSGSVLVSLIRRVRDLSLSSAQASEPHITTQMCTFHKITKRSTTAASDLDLLTTTPPTSGSKQAQSRIPLRHQPHVRNWASPNASTL